MRHAIGRPLYGGFGLMSVYVILQGRYADVLLPPTLSNTAGAACSGLAFTFHSRNCREHTWTPTALSLNHPCWAGGLPLPPPSLVLSPPGSPRGRRSSVNRESDDDELPANLAALLSANRSPAVKQEKTTFETPGGVIIQRGE